MKVGNIAFNEQAWVSKHDSVLDVARVMRNRGVSAVAVVEHIDKDRIPVGIITERDLVLEVLATKIDPNTITAGDIVTSEIVCLVESQDVLQAIEHMRYFAVSHAAVVDVNGGLIGVLHMNALSQKISQTITETLECLVDTPNLSQPLHA